MWLPGFEVVPNRLGRGGSYDDAPWRLVMHTTEVVPSTLSGARDMAARHDAPPHLWVWPERRWKAQTVPLHRAAFALKRPKHPVSPPTNTARAIQVEVIGRAGEALSWPEGWWDWLGTEVVAPIATSVHLNLRRVAETAGPFGYGTDGEVRMTWEEWASFDGICGHANVPGNEHWDPGHADLHRVAAVARRALTPRPIPEEEIPLQTFDVVIPAGGGKATFVGLDGNTHAIAHGSVANILPSTVTPEKALDDGALWLPEGRYAVVTHG